MKTKKLFVYFFLTFYGISLFSFSKGNFSESSDFLIQKKASQNKNNQITYTIQTQKQTFLPMKKELSLVDKISPKAELTSINTLPTSWWIKGNKYDGYPNREFYKQVDQLAWQDKSSLRYQWDQVAMNLNYANGNTLRQDILSSFETYPSLRYPCGVEENNPILQTINQERVLFFYSFDEGIVALNAITGAKKWNVSFSFGTQIINGMSAFSYKGDVYLIAATNQQKVFLYAAENGKLLSTFDVDGNITSPLHSFHFKEEVYVAFNTENEGQIRNVFSGKMIMSTEMRTASFLSPMCVWVGQYQEVIFFAPTGTIVGFNLTTKEIWKNQMKGRLSFTPSFVAWDGLPLLIVATSARNIVLIHASTGDIIDTVVLPGIPKSSVLFLPEQRKYFLVIEEGEYSGETKLSFLEGSFLEKNKKRTLSIPGKEIYGFCGYQQDTVSQFLLLNEKREFYALTVGSKKMDRSVPFLLSQSSEPIQEEARGVCIACTQDMIWLSLPGEGMVRFGNPFPVVQNQEISQNGPFYSGFANTATAWQWEEGCYQICDKMPDTSKISKIPHDIYLHETNRPLPLPTCFWDAYRKQWYFVTIDAQGNLLIRNVELKILYRCELFLGNSFVQPMVEIDTENNWHFFVSSTQKTIHVVFVPESEKTEILWSATDMKSTGSSFHVFRFGKTESLLFVNDRGYLISLDKTSGKLNWKEKVDSYTFASSFLHDAPVIYCGSKIIQAMQGKLLANFGCNGSDSTITTLDGRSLWLQSFEDDMICRNASTGEIIWKVRKLWCKDYCYRSTSPAILKKNGVNFSFWSDYTRVVCVDISTGFIRWRMQLNEDYLVERPIVIDTATRAYVVVTTVKGRIYSLDAYTGEYIPAYSAQLKESPKSDVYSGLSTMGYCNGVFLFSRASEGWYKMGTLSPYSGDYPKKEFSIFAPKKEKPYPIFNRAYIEWGNNTSFSERVKILIQ